MRTCHDMLIQSLSNKTIDVNTVTVCIFQYCYFFLSNFNFASVFIDYVWNFAKFLIVRLSYVKYLYFSIFFSWEDYYKEVWIFHFTIVFTFMISCACFFRAMFLTMSPKVLLNPHNIKYMETYWKHWRCSQIEINKKEI